MPSWSKFFLQCRILRCDYRSHSRIDVLMIAGVKSKCVDSTEKMHQEVKRRREDGNVNWEVNLVYWDGPWSLQHHQGWGGERPTAGGSWESIRVAGALLSGPGSAPHHQQESLAAEQPEQWGSQVGLCFKCLLLGFLADDSSSSS